MADIPSLKKDLVEYLTKQLEHPGEKGVPAVVLTTAAKMVKDFSHEIGQEDAAEATIQDERLRKFLAKRTQASKVN